MESNSFTKDDLIAMAEVFANQFEPDTKFDNFLSAAFVLAAVLVKAGESHIDTVLFKFAQQVCEQANITIESAMEDLDGHTIH